MKQIAVVSGKGGTGKTTLTAAFASLAKDVVLADCDVDAADLHLILKPDIKETIPFYGLKVARKDNGKCTGCGACLEHCKFNAITEDFDIVEGNCEGCGVCEFICPSDAIRLRHRRSGFAYKSSTRFGPMAHAVLKTAEEASGMLVSLVRNNARALAEEQEGKMIIIDGPPGIGCSVIAAISGVDLVLIVTEPTVSGIHDMERILDVAGHFGIPAVVCINKYDINAQNSEKIEGFCKGRGLEVVGKLHYDNVTTEAMIHEKTIIEYSEEEFSTQVKETWKKIEEALT